MHLELFLACSYEAVLDFHCSMLIRIVVMEVMNVGTTIDEVRIHLGMEVRSSCPVAHLDRTEISI